MRDEGVTPEQELKNIQAQGRALADFYTGRLNQAGRDYLNTVLAAINQPAYLQDPQDIAAMQPAPVDVRPTIVAAEGVRELEELDRRVQSWMPIHHKLTICPKDAVIKTNYDDIWHELIVNGLDARRA